MTHSLFTLLGKAARKPPHVVAHRLVSETRRLIDRHTLKGIDSWPSERQLLGDLRANSIAELWHRLAGGPFVVGATNDEAMRRACPAEEREAILAAAKKALSHEVDLLGSGPTSLGERIRWNCDYKTGHAWANGFAADLDYANLDQPSDVKFPWELSRLQWLLPAGQAYVLTGEQTYAAAVRRILEDWIDANPYAWSVNWSCTMEAALRIVTWSWFFHRFHAADAWQDTSFQRKFLAALYAHGRFTEQYLEYSDVNGNHCTADATGLVFAGLFFGGATDSGPRIAKRWQRAGWRLLERELPKQVTADGVDFEGSVPYHRLCAELFFLPALYREQCGLTTPPAYRQRVLAMAHFTQAYTKPTGSAPLWGDADDARTLPLGQQAINDHRYLPSLIGAAWNMAELVESEQRQQGECLWLLGPTGEMHALSASFVPRRSQAFTAAGYYVLRNEVDHVFVDAADVGLAGRGGHGHNDCLSFEAVLNGVELVTDCGAFIYTGSYAARNRFRATGSHNTPMLNGVEINRFFGPKILWTLQHDAIPDVLRWLPGERLDELAVAHGGYQKLATPITPVRSFRLHHATHRLSITDRFEAAPGTQASIEIPLHFAPGVAMRPIDSHTWQLAAGSKAFRLHWNGSNEWDCHPQPCQISPSYGVQVDSQRLVWHFAGEVQAAELSVSLAPW